MSMRGKCVWWLTGDVQCGEPTGYKMVDDGGESGAGKVRRYESFCPPHKAMHEEIELSE
jgi:hypothetical protein